MIFWNMLLSPVFALYIKSFHRFYDALVSGPQQYFAFYPGQRKSEQGMKDLSDLNAHVLLISSRFLSKCFSIRTTGLLSATLTTTCWTSRRSRRHTSCPHPSWWTSTGILTLQTISAWCRGGRTARRISSYLSWDTWRTVSSASSLID